MADTSLWVPLAAAAIAVVGTLAGVVFTQAWNGRLEERRWIRENTRLREAQAREDVNRTYEHRRAAYVDFLQEFERLMRLYIGPRRESVETPALDDPVFDGLGERWTAVRIYGTYEADQAAFHCLESLQIAAIHPEDGVLGEDVYAAEATYPEQIRKDLGVPEWKPGVRRANPA